MPKFTVCELFAGVGGFRLGLEDAGHFKIIWSNQWEPSTKTQHASIIYEARFGTQNHSNQNIETVPTGNIPDHDVLVGGFPCQDYSVATTLNNSKGLLGRKGVLWWSIYRILKEKKNKPKYLILENVDRLLKSPASQRGRDFAVMLKGLSDLGYAAEWRVINAANYGFPQRRRRVFIVGYHKSSALYKAIKKYRLEDWVRNSGVLAHAFPTALDTHGQSNFYLDDDLATLSDRFNKNQNTPPFENSGICVHGKISTLKSIPSYDGMVSTLASILQNGEVANEFFIPEEEIPKWKYHKGSKKEIRTTKEGFQYHYSEGSMVFPDALDGPSRTIITGEGGKSPSRFKHVVSTPKGLRRLTPVELERLNGFPDNHTQLEGITNAKRAFFMGNALVVGIVKKIGEALISKISDAQ
ncbi:MAG: DNA (cytosine-5-)-methyltransferase [Bacteroidota bacterium]